MGRLSIILQCPKTRYGTNFKYFQIRQIFKKNGIARDVFLRESVEAFSALNGTTKVIRNGEEHRKQMKMDAKAVRGMI